MLLHTLADGPATAGDLAALLPIARPGVSRHLRLLREAGLVDSEKVGLWAYYRVNREALDSLRTRIGGELGVLA